MIRLVRWLKLPNWWRIVWAVVLFWGFLWVSPQIYYAYYLVIFDDLPLQVVITWPPPPVGTYGTTILFLTQPDLPDLARGVLFWLMIAAALIPRRERS